MIDTSIVRSEVVAAVIAVADIGIAVVLVVLFTKVYKWFGMGIGSVSTSTPGFLTLERADSYEEFGSMQAVDSAYDRGEITIQEHETLSKQNAGIK